MGDRHRRLRLASPLLLGRGVPPRLLSPWPESRIARGCPAPAPACRSASGPAVLRGSRVRAARRGPAGRLASLLAGLALAGSVFAACGSASTKPAATGRAQVLSGGTAYVAEPPGTPPNYIFPLISGSYYTNENVFDFQTLLYQPLYTFGVDNRPGVDYRLSLGTRPVYSDGDRVVTFSVRPWRWSNGERVDAADVIFWMNLLKANTADWAAYVPGGFPDNVLSYRAISRQTVRFRLAHAYNPTWFTDNELSQITPLPLAWDRTSLSAPAPTSTSKDRPDETTAGARAVYRFLNAEAEKVSTYATSPIWSVVDAPWRLQAISTDGRAVFVPNPTYSGPERPHLARVVELPFTSSAAEMVALRASSAIGGPGTSRSGLTVGYVPDSDLPADGSLRARGFRLEATYPFQFNYFEPNFNNPTVGPLFRQLYIRQAIQHLVNQAGWIRSFYHGLAVPTNGPIPTTPANPWADAAERHDPYPFDVGAAKALLAAHGWTVRPDGLDTCRRAGSGAGECGSGIAAGAPLRFTLLYPAGMTAIDLAVANFQAAARAAGIQIVLQEGTETEVTDTILSCQPSSPACHWQMGIYGVGWVYSPDHFPTGGEIFATGALGNVSNFSSRRIDRLIAATHVASPATEQAALDRYQDAVREDLPDFWEPSPGTMVALAGNLRGYEPNADLFLDPAQWYFVSAREGSRPVRGLGP